MLELLTSMQRHGFAAARAVGGRRPPAPPRPHARLEGLALHLPLAQGSHLGEVRRHLNDAVAAGLDGLDTVWVSHLTADELASLRSSYADFTIRPRVGTDLWLGDRGALSVTATVLDVHEVERGDAFGYRSRTAPKSGHLLVVSGGTAHGIGLEAPMGDSSIKARASTLARGGLDAVGFVRSPFSIDGKQRLFAEPPHMQASMLFLPVGRARARRRRRDRRPGALHRDDVRHDRRHHLTPAAPLGSAPARRRRPRATTRRARPWRPATACRPTCTAMASQ